MSTQQQPEPKQQEDKQKKTLGDRMKEYESAPYAHVDGAYVLPSDGRPVIARIDGHCFSKFTKGFEKPYDERFAKAMVQTACDLLDKFQARTAYTQSDEITLVFVPVQNEKTGEWREWPFRGRVLKWCSLLAGYASARFNYNLRQALQDAEDEFMPKILCWNEVADFWYETNVLERARSSEAHFDARVFAVPNTLEAYNNVYWRMAYDCARNSVHGLARCHFSSKALHGKKRDEQKQMLLEEKNIDYDDMSDGFKFGTFAKKELYTLQTVDHATQEPTEVQRSRVVSFTLDSFDTDLVERRYF